MNCLKCGKELEQKNGKGRPRKYCSNSCRVTKWIKDHKSIVDVEDDIDEEDGSQSEEIGVGSEVCSTGSDNGAGD